jgi:pimeloyl-ACP methyl ester carboxylesterase
VHILQPEVLPSKEQIVAAIYETVLRPQLFDRFTIEQPAPLAISLKHISGRGNPTLDAAELRSHFARALEILEHQWTELGRPYSLAVCTRLQLPGWHSTAAREDNLCFLLGLDGEIIQQPDDQVPDLTGQQLAIQEVRSWLGQARDSSIGWRILVDQIEAQSFSWQDILVLGTSLPNKKFLCRPIWLGDEAGVPRQPVAISAELLDAVWPATAAAFLEGTFGLNPSEVETLRAFTLEGAMHSAGDKDVRQSDLGQIAAKVGAPGVAELLRLVWFLLQEHASDLAIAQGGCLPPSRQMQDDGGHETQYFRLGAETGQPVIYVHGMMDGIAGVQHLQPLLRRRGFRVYAPLRGGYGQSVPPPEEHHQIDDFVAQVEALIEQENLQRPLLLGHRSGVIYARAAALRLRGRIGGMVAAAPTPPLKQVRDYRGLHRFHRPLALSARFAPALSPLVLSSWYKSILKRGAASLVQSQARQGSRGWEQLQDMELDALLSQSLSLMMQQGGKGVLADLKLTAGDWRQQMIGHAARTIYLCGSEDALRRQKGLYPKGLGSETVQFRICAGAGDVLLYVCPDLVLEALEELSVAQNSDFRRRR